MRIPLVISLLIIALAACSKKHSGPPSCSTAPNTITVIDNGATYCIGGKGARISLVATTIIQDNVAAICLSTDTNSVLDFGGDGDAFSITYFNDFGPPHGLGVYSWPIIPGNYALFTEKFSGGHTYTVTGGTVNVSRGDSTKVQATFTLNLVNDSGTKTITGSLITTSP